MSRISQLTGAAFTPAPKRTETETQRPQVIAEPPIRNCWKRDDFQPSRPPAYACLARADDKPTQYACVARPDDKPGHYACSARIDDGAVFEPPVRRFPGIDVRPPMTDCFPDLPGKVELPDFRPPITDCFPDFPSRTESPVYACKAELPRPGQDAAPIYACKAELPRPGEQTPVYACKAELPAGVKGSKE